MGCSTSAPLPYDFKSPASVEYSPADPGSVSGPSGPARRNPKFANELIQTCYPTGFDTLYEGFQRGLKISGDSNCLGTRKMTTDADGKQTLGGYEWKTYTQVAELRDHVGSAMRHLNLLPPVGEPPLQLTAIFSKNREEWVIVEQACNAYGGVVVPLYDTLGAEAVAYILNQTEISTVWADRPSVGVLLKARAETPDSMTAVRHIVQFETPTEEEVKAAADAGITLFSMDHIYTVGKENPAPHTPPKAGDIATFCYTSGTTGNPKGAMLTHGNMVADCSAAIMSGLAITKTDVHISYLPLSHMFERIVQVALFVHGSQIGFYQGSPLKLLEDIGHLQPTLFPSVPRLFNKFYDKVMAGVKAKGGAKAKMFNAGYATKRENLKRNILTSKFWDGKVFSKVKASLGMSRVRMLVTGSAPIAPHVMEFLKIVFAAPVFEGYGQTECAAAATLTDPNDVATSGHVGLPLPCNEIKLVSVEDMGYRYQDKYHGRVEQDGKVLEPGVPCLGRGEVCFRGPNVFVGYYKDDAKTQEALDSEGWLHSGDIGIWTKDGHLRIVDRKKNIFKLSQGEYVAPEKIENVYSRSEFVMQSFVYGDSLQSVLVAVVVPDPDHLATWCPANGVAGLDVAAWVQDPKVKAAILQDIQTVGRANKLKGFEVVKDIVLEAEPWSVENEVLTPTFKLKRNVAKERYSDQIDAMYVGLGGTTAGLKQGAVSSAIEGIETKVDDVTAEVSAKVSSEAAKVSSEASRGQSALSRAVASGEAAASAASRGDAKGAATDAQAAAAAVGSAI